MYKITLALLLVATSLFGQEMDLKWSEKFVYNNKGDGFFDYFIGTNDKYVFAKFSTFTRRGKLKKSKIKIIAFDKTNMTKKAEATVLNTLEDETQREKYKDLYFYKAVVFNQIIYLFYVSENKDKKVEELYAQTFDGSLKKLQPLKKVYELKWNKGDAKKSELFVLANKKIFERILIGGELSAEKNENIKFEYKLLNQDFSFAASNKVTLPVSVTKKTSWELTSQYTFGDDGNLYIKTPVTMSKDDMKNVKKGEPTSYSIFSAVNLIKGEIKSFPVKFENKNIRGYSFTVTPEGAKLYGFFTDIIKDPKANDIHGLFYAMVNKNTLELSDMKFTSFTKEQLDKLFAGDKDKRDRNDKSLLQTKKKKKSEEESIASNYLIEDIQTIDKNSLVLFCSIMYNYTRTYTDSKGNTHVRYYCQKSNVTAFKVDQSGSLIWASNMDRMKTYSGWNIYDVSVVNKNGKYFIIYGSDFYATAEKKNRKSKKKRAYERDRMEYAVLDDATGTFTKQELTVNKLNTKKSERKAVSPSNITVLDNQFYTSNSRIRLKPHVIPITILCYPIGYILYNSPGSFKGSGSLGAIYPVK